MAILAKWTGDGLSSGAVTTSTAGTGDTAFNVATSGAGTISATGTRSPRIQVAQAAATAAQYAWTSGVIGTRTSYAVRVYFEWATFPSAAGPILSGYGTSNTALAWRINITSTGQLRLLNASATQVADSGAVLLSSGTVYRIEVVVSSGSCTVRAYAGDFATAYITLTGTVGGTIDAIRIGNTQTSPTFPTWRFDSVSASDTAALIGPVLDPVPSDVIGTFLRQNSFAGGTNGTGITTGNSGGASGNAFDLVFGSPTYSSAHAAMAAALPDSSAAFIWTITPAGRTVWLRASVYLTGYPSSDSAVIFDDNSYALVQVRADGKVEIYAGGFSNEPGTRVVTAATIPLNQQVRIEAKFVYGTTITSGACELRVYHTATSSTATETLTASNINMGTTAATGMWFQGLAGIACEMDNIAVTDMGWLGPVAGAAAPPPPRSSVYRTLLAR